MKRNRSNDVLKRHDDLYLSGKDHFSSLNPTESLDGSGHVGRHNKYRQEKLKIGMVFYN